MVFLLYKCGSVLNPKGEMSVRKELNTNNCGIVVGKSTKLSSGCCLGGERSCRNFVLLLGVIVMLTGCSLVYFCMEPGDWVMNQVQRNRVLMVVGVVFLLSVCICYYAAKTESKYDTELQVLVTDKPPNYDTVVIQHPPPSYEVVIQMGYPVHLQSTG